MIFLLNWNNKKKSVSNWSISILLDGDELRALTPITPPFPSVPVLGPPLVCPGKVMLNTASSTSAIPGSAFFQRLRNLALPLWFNQFLKRRIVLKRFKIHHWMKSCIFFCVREVHLFFIVNSSTNLILPVL